MYLGKKISSLIDDDTVCRPWLFIDRLFMTKHLRKNQVMKLQLLLIGMQLLPIFKHVIAMPHLALKSNLKGLATLSILIQKLLPVEMILKLSNLMLQQSQDPLIWLYIWQMMKVHFGESLALPGALQCVPVLQTILGKPPSMSGVQLLLHLEG